MSIVFTQDDLDALKEAYLTGARKVRIGDREIEYRSQAEILAAMNNVKAYLEGNASSESQPSLIQATFSKGKS